MVIPRFIAPLRAEIIFILMINSIPDTTNKTFYHETITEIRLFMYVLNASVHGSVTTASSTEINHMKQH
jgi:hypothetical protein